MDATIKLSQTYAFTGGSITELTFREPTGAAYWAIGPITEWQRVGESLALITHHDRVKAYAERQLNVPAGEMATVILAGISLADTLQVERAISDFFTKASARLSEPATS